MQEYDVSQWLINIKIFFIWEIIVTYKYDQ